REVTALPTRRSSDLGSENGVQISIDAGSYSVNETGGPSNYSQSLGAGCSGTMTNGGNATCTITNNDTPPTLTIIKQVANSNGGTDPTSTRLNSIHER